MTPSLELDTPRLSLRPMLSRDAPFFFRLVGNHQVRRFLGGTIPWVERPSRFVAQMARAQAKGIWIVESREDHKATGLIELSQHKDGRDIEISYQFHPGYWGRGFASEAIARVLEHSLQDLALPRVIAETQRANAASCRLLQGLGMVEIDRLERFGAEQVIYATQTSDND